MSETASQRSGTSGGPASETASRAADGAFLKKRQGREGRLKAEMAWHWHAVSFGATCVCAPNTTPHARGWTGVDAAAAHCRERSHHSGQG